MPVDPICICASLASLGTKLQVELRDALKKDEYDHLIK